MKSIRQKLTRKLLLGATLLLGCGAIAVYFSTRDALLEQFDGTLRAKANAVSSAVELHGKRISLEFSEEYLREFRHGVPFDFYQMRSENGATVWRSKSLETSDLPSNYGTFQRPEKWNLTLPTGQPGRAIAYTFNPQSSKAGEAVESPSLSIVVATDRRELDERLTELSLVLLACGAAMIAAVIFSVPRLLKNGLLPLEALAKQASEVHADTLDIRFPVETLPTELIPIGNHWNDLLERLQHAFERERQFSADLAHELRTPIAELRGLAEVGLKWPETRGTESDCDALAIAHQLENMVTRLLALQRSESGQVAVNRECVPLMDFLTAIWQPFTRKADEKQLTLALHLEPETKIYTDPTLLRSIVSNLMENAVEYTPFAGAIWIESSVSEREIQIRVRNLTDNIESADLPKFFDRFWRKDAARSDGKHSGLGLPLARSFANALGWRLEVDLDPDSNLTFTLRGPVITC